MVNQKLSENVPDAFDFEK